MKVYVVHFGHWSDRWLRAVFSTKEKAQQYYEECKDSSDANEPEEFELDSTD